MTKSEFNEVVDNLRIGEWRPDQDAFRRVLVVVGQVVRPLTCEAVAEFINGLSPRQMRLLKQIAEAQIGIPIH
jgi:hypothetical protein